MFSREDNGTQLKSIHGGRRVYIETSSKAIYRDTRVFYERRGYRAEATLKEFYSPGDHKVIYVKTLSSA